MASRLPAGRVAAGGSSRSPTRRCLSPVRRAPREERSRRTAMSMMPIRGVNPYRRRVRNARGDGRPRVYIVARNTIRERRVAQVEANITGTVWKIEVAVGDEVAEGDTVVILESMKMEMPVESEDDGTVKEIRCEEGQAVNEGETLVVLE